MVTLLSASSTFNWSGLVVGIVIVLSAAAAHFIGLKKKNGFYKDLVFDILLWTIIPAFFFSRLYYVIFFNVTNKDAFGFQDFFDFTQGGLSFYGALFGGLVGLVVLYFIRRKKDDSVGLTEMLDFATPFLISGQAVVSLFGFLGESSYGKYIGQSSFFPVGVYIESGSYGAGWYQATFFYESLWCIVGAIALTYIYFSSVRQSFNGFVFALYAVFYGIGKLWIDNICLNTLYMSAPEIDGSGGLKAAVFFSICMIIIGVGYIAYHLLMANRKGKKLFIFAPFENVDTSKYYRFNSRLLYKELPPSDDLGLSEEEKREIEQEVKKELSTSGAVPAKKVAKQPKKPENFIDGFED